MKIFKNIKIKYIIITSFVSTFVVTGLIITYYNSIPKEEPLIGAYIDGTYSETLPSKDSGYVVEKIVCDNNKNASWDNDKWGIKLSNWSTRSRCNIYFKRLESFILANKTFYLDEMQRCPTMNSDGTVTVTEAEDTYGYLCKAKDAYGDSYYYRGNVTNNYVLFAGKYWRIIRYNGDGTVRVIYDGTSAHANGESSADRQIGTTKFNYYWKKDNVKESTNSYVYYDNAGVGYMYGNRDGIIEPSTQYSTQDAVRSYTNTDIYYIAKEYTYNASTDRFTLKDPIAVLGSEMTSDYVGYYTFNRTSSSYSYQDVYKITSVTADSSKVIVRYKYVTYGTTSKEKAQTNTNSSDIKSYLDTWYENNIKGTTNEQYIADNIFCNDRSFASNNSGTGAGTSTTYYRWYNFAGNSNNNKMMLTCPQKNDAFTVSDTSNGNGALTYGVGLVTTDEVVLAGGWGLSNSNYYLYSGRYYWTMSPYYFSGAVAYERVVISSGHADFHTDVGDTIGARPVFNLKSEILKNGNGTASDPYHA